MRSIDPTTAVVAFADDQRTLVFLGNAQVRSILTAASLADLFEDEHTVRAFSTEWNDWQSLGKLPKATILHGLAVTIDARGFALIEITPP